MNKLRIIAAFALVALIGGIMPSAVAEAATATPQVTLTANTKTIGIGGSATLRWTSKHAKTCSVMSWGEDKAWIGKKPLNGSVVVRPENTTTYEIRCYNGSRQSSAQNVAIVVDRSISAQSTVAPMSTTVKTVATPASMQAPWVNLNISRTSVAYGEPVTLTWNADRATSCVANSNSYQWSDAKPTAGYQTIYPYGPTTFSLTCYNANGRGTAHRSISVYEAATPAPQITLSTSKSIVSAGENAVLKWTTGNAQTCNLTSSSANGRWVEYNKPQNGTMTVSPKAFTTYTLTCSNGTTASSVSTAVDVQNTNFCTPALPYALTDRWNGEGNGNNVVTSSRSASTFGSHSYAPGKFGQAFSFDGIDDYATAQRAVRNDFTISFFMKTTQTGGTGQWFNGRGLIDTDVQYGNKDFGVALVGDKVGFGTSFNGDQTIYSSTRVNDGQWHHVTVSREMNSGEMRLYVDGNLEAFTVHAAGASLDGSETMAFGTIRHLTSQYYFFNGQLDDIQLYNKVLSASDVNRISYGQCR